MKKCNYCNKELEITLFITNGKEYCECNNCREYIRKNMEESSKKKNYDKIKILCEFQTSPFCKKQYEIGKYRANCNLKNNGGKYRCKLCAINETHLGNKSHFFKNIPIEHNFFSTIDSEIKAYLLGVIAGDGHISAKEIELVANDKDIETLNLFKTNIAKETNIKHKRNSNCSYIKIVSRDMVKDLCVWLSINPGKKSSIIKFPNIEDKLLPHFIRGLIDTDGCIDNPSTYKYGPRCFYSSTSKFMLKSLSDFCILHNIKGYLSGIKLVFTGRNALLFLNMIYINSNVFLSRKKHFYDIWKTWIPYKGTCINPSKRKKKGIK